MNPWPISPLTPKDLDFVPVDYDFSGRTAEELSSLPNLEASIDAELIDAAASVADQVILIASMDNDLDDAGTVLNELGVDDVSQFAGDIASAGTAGDGLLSDFAQTLGDNTSSGGGGGGTGPSKQYWARLTITMNDGWVVTLDYTAEVP